MFRILALLGSPPLGRQTEPEALKIMVTESKFLSSNPDFLAGRVSEGLTAPGLR